MALFGDTMGQFVTPDGRTITLPQQLAQQFPGLKPPAPPEVAQPPALPVAPPPPVSTPADQADIAQRTAPPPDTAAAAPVTSPSQVAPSGTQAPLGPVESPTQASDAGPPNTPARAPVTNEQLAKMGVAGGLNAELAANDAQAAATQRQGAALASQADKVGAAMAASEQEASRLLEARRKAAEDNARDMQARTEAYFRDAKAIADTKIDRSVDHPILAAIGVALGAIGGAMMQKQNGGALTNPGLDALYKAIDRKVAGQMQDLDIKRQGLATQRDALGMARQAGQDRLTEMDAYRLGYIEQAKRQVETIKQQTTSDVVRANADVALAGLQQKAAETVSTAQNRWQTQRDAELARKQTLQIAQMSNATQRRGQDLEQKRFDQQLEFQKQKEVDEIATKIATAKGVAKDAVAKQISEQGIVDPATGNLMLTPEGQKKLADADKAEAAARAAKDPAQAQKLNAYAQQLRDSAQVNDVALALNKGGAEAAQKVVGMTQNLVNDIDSAKELLSGDPSSFDRERWAKAKVGLQNVKINYASTIGERLSVRALEALDDVLSIDTDSMLSRFADKSKALASLKILNDELVQKANVAIRNTGVKATWYPATAAPADQLAEGKTAQEVAADAKPGIISRGLTHLLNPLGDAAAEKIQAPQDEALDEAAARKNAKGESSAYGLAPETDDKIRALVSQSAKVSHAKYADIVSKIAAPLQGDRPSLATGIAKLVRDTDPKLFADVMAALPEPTRAELSQSIAPPQVTGPLPQRTLSELSPEERAQFDAQRRERTMGAERASDEEFFRKNREAYDRRRAQ